MPLFPWFVRKNSCPSSRGNKRPRSLQLERLEDRTVPIAGFADGTFGISGVSNLGINLGSFKNDGAEAVVVQPDGKTVVAGFAQKGSSDLDFLVARFDRDGDLDTTFNSPKGFNVISFNLGGSNEDRAKAIALQPDGKIVVAGFASTAAGTDFAICRFTSTGELDTSFDGNGKRVISFNIGGDESDQANAIALQPNGKILVGGFASTATNGRDFAVVRLLANGDLDTAFDGDGRKTLPVDIGGTDNDAISGIVVTPNGNILLAGTAENSSTLSEGALVRLTPTGALDTTFSSTQGGVFTFRYSNLLGVNTIASIAQSPDGKFVVTGKTPNPFGSDSNVGLARFSPQGQFDNTFSNDGRTTLFFSNSGTKEDSPEAILLQQDGKIVVGGFANRDVGGVLETDFVMARFLPSGLLDPSFNLSGLRFFDQTPGGTNFNDVARAMALSPDGIVLVGNVATATDGSDVSLLRVTRDVWVIASADKGGPNLVKMFTPTGTLLRQFNPFPGGALLGVRVAGGDINGDGAPELFCTQGPGGFPVVKIFDGFTFELIREISAFGSAFRGGVNVVVGDVLGDQAFEMVVGPVVGGPFVKVFDPNSSGGPLRTFTVFPTGSNQGLRLALGDHDGGDQRDEIYVSRAGPSNAVVRVINGDTGALIKSVTVFGNFQGGINVGSVDGTNDGKFDLVVSRDAAGTPPVLNILKSTDNSLVRQISAYAPSITQGIRIWAGPLFLGGSNVNIITSVRPGGFPRIKVFDAFNGNVLSTFDAFASNMTAGVFVLGLIR